MKRLLVICAVCGIIAGCIGSPGSVQIHYFSINTDPDIEKAAASLPASLWIPDFRAASRYEYNMLFRTDEFGIGYMEFDRWIERPEEMVKRAFAMCMEKSGTFNKIQYGAVTEPTDYMLDGYLLEFDELRSGGVWKARFSIRLTLSKTLQRITIWNSVITTECEMEYNHSGGFAIAMSAAVLEAVQKVIAEAGAVIRKDNAEKL